MANVKEIKQGDTITFRLKATDSNGASVPIDGYVSASLKIAKSLNIDDGDAMHYEIVLAADFSDGAGGIHDFKLLEDTTKVFKRGEHKYQMRLVDSTNEPTSSAVKTIDIVQNLIDDEA